MNAVFKVLIVYQTFEYGSRARVVVERLANQIQLTAQIECDGWNFSWLDQPRFWDRAAREAAAADIIIVSAQSAKELPAHVKAWLQVWMPRKKNSSSALIAMFDDQQSSQPLHTYLSEMAVERGRDLFWQNYSPAAAFPPTAPERRQFAGSFIGVDAHIGARDWGINE